MVETNASDYVFREIITQFDKNKSLHPMKYYFKTYFPIEYNYEIYNKKLIAIVRAFEKWCPELERLTFSIHNIILNHKNLEYFIKSKQLSHQQAR